VTVDWVSVAIGAAFILWAWWVPRQMRGIRDRVAERGGDVERFERFRHGRLMRAAPAVGVGAGVILIVTGLLLA
jgi:hypothetical protein